MCIWYDRASSNPIEIIFAIIFLFLAGKIAWDYLERTLEKMIAWSNRPPLFSRKSENFDFNEEDFKDAVVVPTYRNQGTDACVLPLHAQSMRKFAPIAVSLYFRAG